MSGFFILLGFFVALVSVCLGFFFLILYDRLGDFVWLVFVSFV